MTQTIRILLNGEPRDMPGDTDIIAMLMRGGLAARRVAVEVNGGIVPRGQHAGYMLRDGDRVEIVHALGGG